MSTTPRRAPSCPTPRRLCTKTRRPFIRITGCSAHGSKLCFLLAVEPSAAQLGRLRALADAFQGSLDDLGRLPLTTDAFRTELATATRQWQRLHGALAAIAEPATLTDVSDASEHLLESSERLTELYDRAMQMLIGNRVGRMA